MGHTSSDNVKTSSSVEERKRIQNRLAQRRHRQKTKAFRPQGFAAASSPNEGDGNVDHPSPFDVTGKNWTLDSNAVSPVQQPLESSKTDFRTVNSFNGGKPHESQGMESNDNNSNPRPPSSSKFEPYPDQSSISSGWTMMHAHDSADLSDLFSSVEPSTFEDMDLTGTQVHDFDFRSNVTQGSFLNWQQSSAPSHHNQSARFLLLQSSIDDSNMLTKGERKASEDTVPPPATAREHCHPSVRNSHDDIERKLESILDRCSEVGFENFESLAIAYYTSDLDDSSPIGQAQRLSRSRHIRSLLSALSHSSKLWEEPETRPWREEILKAAEAIYASEMHDFQLQQGPQLIQDPAQFLHHCISGQYDSSVERVLHRDLQRKVPELWSFFTALVQRLGVLPSKANQTVCLMILFLCRVRLQGSGNCSNLCRRQS
ncbi:hypothetical protein AOQ84DRAFT_55723 [Glonium stellatum]|uniref:BZIP domain-containing protein n=1 Tax=Glonium stellatum TaxID=574774 RepID=A0A8E2EZU9_9PEZI|nr:hypothetical protein AOQ84DRAFT_55723 [Glonium stellatum]